MKRKKGGIVLVCLLLAGFIGEAAAERYRTGALREEELPGWVLPSPRIEFYGSPDELDEQVDNSAGLPPVGNQAQQGSCTAWATAYYYLTYLQWQEYGWDLSDPAHQCSPAFTYNMINGGIDGGSFPTDAFLLFEQAGCGTMEDMSYSDRDHESLPSETAFRNGHLFRTAETYSINTYSQQGLEDLKNHLRNGNIAMTAITVWSNFQNIGRFDDTYCVSEIYGDEPGGHAVAIVGFDDERETADGTGAFYMVNSWGTGWGDNGFWWMSYEAMSDRRINWGSALYASDRLDYQPELVARVKLDHGDRHSLYSRAGIGSPNAPLSSIQFFDFYIESREDLRIDSRNMVLDFTDLVDFVDTDTPNQLFIRVYDSDRDGVSGEVEEFVIEDLEREHYAISETTPTAIVDYGSAEANAVLYYEIVPPENIAAEMDLATGEVHLSWDDPNELDEFNSFIVYRDSIQVGTTESCFFTDQLEDFGVYRYYLVADWDEADSWASEEVEVNYIEPVAPTHAGVREVDGETGEFTLGWEQLRSVQLKLDDGDAEAGIYPSGDAQVGTMIAQRFTAPADGKAVQVGAFFWENRRIENGRVRFVLFRNGENDLPGEEFYRSWEVVPDNGWYWFWLGANRMPLENGEEFWAAVCWEELERTRLGRDLDGEQYNRKAMNIDRETWVEMHAPGNPMIRVRYGTEEQIGDWTGLQHFQVFLNNERIATVDEDVHTVSGTLPGHGEYSFRVDAVYLQGTWEGRAVELDWQGQTVGVEDGKQVAPLTWRLGSPYPNPFNAKVSVKLELPDAAVVRATVHNINGRQVAVLADRPFTGGVHRLTFDGSHLASGLYLLNVVVPGNLNESRKILLLK